MWSQVEKSGSWLKVALALRDEVKAETSVEMPEKIQGLDNLYAYLEETKVVSDYLYEKFLALITGKKAS